MILIHALEASPAVADSIFNEIIPFSFCTLVCRPFKSACEEFTTCSICPGTSQKTKNLQRSSFSHRPLTLEAPIGDLFSLGAPYWWRWVINYCMQQNYSYKLYKKLKMVITISCKYCQIIIYKMLIFFWSTFRHKFNRFKIPLYKNVEWGKGALNRYRPSFLNQVQDRLYPLWENFQEHIPRE